MDVKAPSSASAASPSTCLPMSDVFSPDWGDDEDQQEIEDAFVSLDSQDAECGRKEDAEAAADLCTASQEFKESLEKPVDECTAAKIETAVQLADARADVLPPFLQWENQTWQQHSEEHAEMQQIKMQEIEHVRYRCVANHPKDVKLKAFLECIQAAANDYFYKDDIDRTLSHMDLSDHGPKFVNAAHRRSLWVVGLQQ